MEPKQLGRARCPYCEKKVNLMVAWGLRRRGEYRCPRCNGISNVTHSRLLLPLAKAFVTVTAPSPRAIPAAELAARIEALGGRAEPADTIPAAVARTDALAAGGPAAALGTLYFSGEVREAVEKQKAFQKLQADVEMGWQSAKESGWLSLDEVEKQLL